MFTSMRWQAPSRVPLPQPSQHCWPPGAAPLIPARAHMSMPSTVLILHSANIMLTGRSVIHPILREHLRAHMLRRLASTDIQRRAFNATRGASMSLFCFGVCSSEEGKRFVSVLDYLHDKLVLVVLAISYLSRVCTASRSDSKVFSAPFPGPVDHRMSRAAFHKKQDEVVSLSWLPRWWPAASCDSPFQLGAPNCDIGRSTTH